jgi:hypothetical protein
VKRLIPKYDRIIVIDPMWEYDGQTICESLESFRQYFDTFGTYGKFYISYRKKNQIDYDAIFRACWSLGNVLLVCEEADLIIGSRNKYFDQLVGQGRHRNIHIICIARRVPDVDKDFRAQATSFFSFYQSEPDDIGHLQEWGFQTDLIPTLKVKLEDPYIPQENVNYVRMGESFEEIEFTKETRLTPNSYMEE